MSKADTFSGFNPVINFVFFIGAIVFGMFFTDVLYLACALVFSFSYYFTVAGRSGLGFLAGMIPMFIILSAASPLFNPNGQTVLFTWIGGRPYTLEALNYGVRLAAMFISVLTWFASYNRVMTSDKFMYIFGRTAPSVSLVLSMILRLVPSFRRKLGQISGARMCVGKAGSSGTKKEKLDNGMTLVSALTTWALEGGIVTADSMRSRGYGSGRRTSFAIYRFDRRDRALLSVMVLLIAAVLVLNLAGGKTALTAGAVFYAVFLAIPTIINVTEEIIWRILRSGI
ncbi:MAG: energy-coupling factor transporter transmembrane component T [Anaerovoracaceae bacterium]|nr:energy-coupling factor transporter transmembrane component T [Anaerovoracaceae bacterium]